MATRRARWPVLVTLSAIVGLVIATGAFYLPDVVSVRGQYYDGRPAGYWVRALKSPDVEARRRAIRAVSSFGSDGTDEAVPVLARILGEDPDPEARVLASLALAKMVPASRAAVPELARALADADPLIRMNSANALFLLGSDARPVIPALTKALDSDLNDIAVHGFTVTIREVLVLALGRASCRNPDALPVLRETLKTAKTAGLRRAAAQGLGDIGPEARPAGPDLRDLLRDEHSEIRKAAEEALRKIDG